MGCCGLSPAVPAPSGLSATLSLSLREERSQRVHMCSSFKHFMFASLPLKSVQGWNSRYQWDRFRGMDTFLLPLNCISWSASCPVPRWGMGSPLCHSLHSWSQNQAEIYPWGSVNQEVIISPLDGVAGYGAAPGVAGWGPGQDEAVSVHIQASQIQRGARGPWLLSCSI